LHFEATGSVASFDIEGALQEAADSLAVRGSPGVIQHSPAQQIQIEEEEEEYIESDSDEEMPGVPDFHTGVTVVHDWVLRAQAQLDSPANRRYFTGNQAARNAAECAFILASFDAPALELWKRHKEEAIDGSLDDITVGAMTAESWTMSLDDGDIIFSGRGHVVLESQFYDSCKQVDTD
jgi:hypothetical protein